MYETTGRAKFYKTLITIVLCSLSLVLVLPGQVRTQELAKDARVAEALHLLEIWVEAQLAYERIPGISMSVVHDQELVWSRGFGYSDLEKKTPTTPKTVYSICSISKLFTSIAVLQLRDRGLLRLDDEVKQHLAWFNIEETYKKDGPIIIEGLLTHSSGLPREADFPYWTEASFPAREKIVERVSHQKTLYPARTHYQYSNLGLTLAGEIVAQVSGKSYADYVKENILAPLGLADTSPEIPQALKGKQLATGYGAFKRDGTRDTVPFFQVRGIAPAAGYASTVEDLAKFASWQFRLLENGDDEILNHNTLRDMHRVHWMDPNWRTTRGLGFSVWRSKDKTFVGHGGTCPGYRSNLTLRPEEKFAAVFMANTLGVRSRLFTQRAYEIVAPAIAEALVSPDDAKQADEALTIYTGLYERPIGGETAVITWKGGLAMVSLPTEDPLERLTKLKHIDGHTFKRIRDDKELGEEILFVVDEKSGQVIKMWQHNNYRIKIREHMLSTIKR